MLSALSDLFVNSALPGARALEHDSDRSGGAEVGHKEAPPSANPAPRAEKIHGTNVLGSGGRNRVRADRLAKN